MTAAPDLTDGIDLLPSEPGIYCILNRFSGRKRVGLAGSNMRTRAMAHRRSWARLEAVEPPMRADMLWYGVEAFVFLSLEVHRPTDGEPVSLVALRKRELWWAHQLACLDERFGYNLEAGGVRSAASRFRDRERKLMRSNSRKYMLLPGVHLDDPIGHPLLSSWLRVEAASSQGFTGKSLTTMHLGPEFGRI